MQETNVRAAFLLTQGFAALLGKERKGNIVSVTSAAAVLVFAGMSSYSLSKLAAIQLQAFVAAEYPNITAIAHHPGIVLTDSTLDYFRPFAKGQSVALRRLCTNKSLGRHPGLGRRSGSMALD